MATCPQNCLACSQHISTAPELPVFVDGDDVAAFDEALLVAQLARANAACTGLPQFGGEDL